MLSASIAGECPELCLPSPFMSAGCTHRYHYGSECRSYCDRNHVLADPELGVVTCTEQHSWEGDLSTCVG